MTIFFGHQRFYSASLLVFNLSLWTRSLLNVAWLYDGSSHLTRIPHYPYANAPKVWSFLGFLPQSIQHMISKSACERMLRSNTSPEYFPDQFLQGGECVVLIAGIRLYSSCKNVQCKVFLTRTPSPPTHTHSLSLWFLLNNAISWTRDPSNAASPVYKCRPRATETHDDAGVV